MIAAFIARWIAPYALMILAGLLAMATTAAGVQTLRLAWLKSEVAEAGKVASEKAREREHEWGLIVQEIDDAKETQIRAVAADRDRALASLRQRPARLPEAATAAGQCDGATGKQLSRDDAEFLVRLAARADEQAAQLSACQSWARAVTQ